MNNKQEAALKIVKLLNLYNNEASTNNEKMIAKSKIDELCVKFHFRIQDSTIIDIDIEKRNATQNQYVAKEVDPYRTGSYVIYKGVKYYQQKGKGPPVPRQMFDKRYIGVRR